MNNLDYTMIQNNFCIRGHVSWENVNKIFTFIGLNNREV